MDARHPRVRFGQLLDVRGTAVEYSDWLFVPAIVNLEGFESGFEFTDDRAAVGVCYPRDADAAFVRARIPQVFAYTPVYDESNEKCLLWEGFVAVRSDRSEGIPFICSDYYGKSKLYFNEEGADRNTRESIASAFWKLIAQDPCSVDDFEQGVFHYGACVMMYFGCKDGHPYYREDE